MYYVKTAKCNQRVIFSSCSVAILVFSHRMLSAGKTFLQGRGYLPSRRKPPPFGQYQINCLMTEARAHVCEQLTASRHVEVERRESSRLGMKKSGIFHQWLMAIGQKLNKVRSIPRDNRVLL